MAGLAGYFNRDGRDADPRILKNLMGAVEDRGADGLSTWVDGPAALGVARYQTTPEAEPEPLNDTDSGVSVILDGRLDGRGELEDEADAASLGVRPGVSDATLALLLYLRHGVAFTRYLLGDFALVIWDRRQGRLICVRDAFGLRPFYYTVSRERFVFGSNPHAVLRHPGVTATPNPGMIGEYLAFAFCSKDETLYREVRRLPPGHLMIVDRGGHSIQRYWDLDPDLRIRYRDARDYSAHFRELFRQSVADRLRRTGPIGVTLSGGLDSSSVAGMAQQLLDDEGSGCRLNAYSMTYPGQTCDESPFIDAVVGRWRLQSRRFPWTGFDSCPWVEQAATFKDVPEFPLSTHVSAMFRGARSDGVRVLLTGEGGDFWQDGSRLPYRHLLDELRLGRMAREFGHAAHSFGILRAVRWVTASLLWGVTPARIRRRVESGRVLTSRSPFLAAAFLREIDLPRRLHGDDCADRYPDASQWQIVKWARSGILLHFYEMVERSAASQGIELRHPLWDRRLIEYTLAVPDHVRRHTKRDRTMFRDAAADLLPDPVRIRTGAARFDIVLSRSLLLPEVQQVLQAPVILERPWIDPDRYRVHLNETVSACRSGANPPMYDVCALWMVFAVEVWFRNTLLDHGQ
jgi:asparagine synthase (glutamine-hydrolysing)